MRITDKQAAEMLLSMDNILILTHKNPDGDAVGSACALCIGLRQLGKRAYVNLSGISKHDAVHAEGMLQNDFTPDYVISVDTADRSMLDLEGTSLKEDCRVVLAIDHHMSNTFYAENTFLDEEAAAAAEAVYTVLLLMKASITAEVGERIYLGISTDTGCFRYANTTARTHRIAAEMAEIGVDIASINKEQFETKSREYAELEKQVISGMEIHFSGKLAMMSVTYDMFRDSGVRESEMGALSALPRQIEGVMMGITLKEKEKGKVRLSIRTNDPVNASEFAKNFEGGGHKNAAGGVFYGTVAQAKKAILSAAERYFEETNI